MTKQNHSTLLLIGVITFSILFSAQAEQIDYELTVAEETRVMADRPVRALTLNGGVPGPVLRFKVGDTARIQVHNRLGKETTSIHWHGLLLPNKEDGVPFLTTPPIKPGTTHTFNFPLSHAGTYWYHSHTGLQEQRGVYGSIVVEPREGEPVAADHDYVIQLSDWTNEHPKEVMRSLRRGSEYYAFKKGVTQSIWGAYKKGYLGQYLAREKSRMPPMDIADVAYDAFLINGKENSLLEAKPGERVRLRIINSGASTYFYVQSSTGPMTVVAADGPAVEAFEIDRLLIGMAETYDVIVTIPQETGSWEFRATAQDGSGHASVWLGEGAKQSAANIPQPNVYDMDSLMMQALDEGDLTGGKSHMQMQMQHPMKMKMKDDMGKIPMKTDKPMAEKMKGKMKVEMKADKPMPEKMATSMPKASARPLSPYRQLRAPAPTTLPKENPTRSITLRLTGDMQRYIWSFNGKMLSEESMIKVTQGENLRIEMINDTMMHHPIHLHGHFFRLLNGQGENAPLKHTVDVPPMTRRIIEFEANEEKDWFFHCHLLYHMMAGMTRVVSYTEQGPDHKPNLGPHERDEWLNWGTASIQSHMTEGLITWSSPRNDIKLAWEYGWGKVDETEHETDLYWKHYYNPNWQTFAGARFTNEDDAQNRGIAGARYRLPWLIMSEWGIDTEGDVRVRLDKEIQLTNHAALFGEIQYDTGSEWEGSAGLTWTLNKPLSLIGQYHSSYGLGGGIVARF
jgi:CopA family copper-resistance protein